MAVLGEIVFILFLLVQALLAVYIALPALLLVSYALIRLFRIRTPFQRKPFLTEQEFEFGLIITAHQETEFVIPLVDSILKQTYQRFHVYIVADDCAPGALSFRTPGSPSFHPILPSIPRYGPSVMRSTASSGRMTP